MNIPDITYTRKTMHQARLMARQRAKHAIQAMTSIEKHVFSMVFKDIDAAAKQGSSSVDIAVKHIDSANVESEKIGRILRDLGYGIDWSCSSNRENERMFVKWGKTE